MDYLWAFLKPYQYPPNWEDDDEIAKETEADTPSCKGYADNIEVRYSVGITIEVERLISKKKDKFLHSQELSVKMKMCLDSIAALSHHVYLHEENKRLFIGLTHFFSLKMHTFICEYGLKDEEYFINEGAWKFTRLTTQMLAFEPSSLEKFMDINNYFAVASAYFSNPLLQSHLCRTTNTCIIFLLEI
jgi:hypothetical protein